MKHYFFTTVKKEKSVKVVPLEKQVFEDGKAVETNVNVSCSKTVRESVPVGAIFVSDGLSICSKSSSKTVYYKATKFRAITKDDKDIADEYNSLYVKEGSTDKKIDVTTILTDIMLDTKLTAPTSSGDGFFMTTDDWTLLIRNIKKHINTMIIGPTGSGKTTCVKELCNRLGLKLHIFDMGSMMDPISSLLGVHRLEKGGSIFDYAKFTQVIQEPCVILLDELSRAPLSAMNVLFSCLDDRRTLSIEIAGGKDKREINVHPDVTFIATANVGAEYSGTNTMDRALVNRFFPIELGCIPTEEEEKVLMKRCGINNDNAKLIVKIANNIRSLSNKQEVSVSLSIRETLMVGNLVADGWDLGKAMEMIYLPLYEGTKAEGERGTIYKTISSY